MTPFPSPRALTVRSAAIPELAGAPALVPLKLQGHEGINGLFEYRLVLQTPDAYNFRAGEGANFDLDAFVGRELTCAIELEGHGSFTPGVPGGLGAHQGAGERELSGLITQARFLGECGRHALYELTLRPWLHLATLTTDCRVFQDRSPVEIIEDVLARYAFACERRLIETYPRVDYTVQYNESDFEFVTRLMQAWGINYHFEHTGGVHRLVWSDHNGAFQPTQSSRSGQPADTSAYHRIPFYPLGHKIDREYIHGFSPTDGLTSGSYLPLMDMNTRQGAQALRDMLRLFVGADDAIAGRQVDGLIGSRIAPVTRRLPGNGPLVYGRGVQCDLTVDEDAFSGTSPYLFGLVLEHYLARHVSINVFTETRLESMQRGMVASWAARMGTRSMV